MTCPICSGSGERDGEYGLLSCDAPNCTAATERAALEAANKAAEPMTVYDQRWFAYQAGKAAALEQAANLFPQPYMEYFGSNIQDSIRELKP